MDQKFISLPPRSSDKYSKGMIQPYTKDELEAKDWTFKAEGVDDGPRTLLDVKVGDNLRGARLEFVPDGRAVGVSSFQNISFRFEGVGMATISYSSSTIYYDKPDGLDVVYDDIDGWQNTVIDFPSDTDVIVTNSNITAGTDMIWGFENVLVESVDPIEVRLAELESKIEKAWLRDDAGNYVIDEGKKILSRRADKSTHHLLSEEAYPLSSDPTQTVHYVELGNTSAHFQGNTSEDPEFGTHGTMDTPNGKKEFMYVEEGSRSIRDLQPGDNLRGITIEFIPDDRPVNSTPTQQYIRYSVEGDSTYYSINYYQASILFDLPGVQMFIHTNVDGWYQTVITFPDDKDVIVIDFDFEPESTEVWGFENTVIPAIDVIEILEGRVEVLEGKVATLQTADSQNVKLTGAQTINDNKIFINPVQSNAVIPRSSQGDDIGTANRQYRSAFFSQPINISGSLVSPNYRDYGDLSVIGQGISVTLGDVTFLVRRLDTTTIEIRATSANSTVIPLTHRFSGASLTDAVRSAPITVTPTGTVIDTIPVGSIVIADLFTHIGNYGYDITAGSDDDALTQAWVEVKTSYIRSTTRSTAGVFSHVLDVQAKDVTDEDDN